MSSMIVKSLQVAYAKASGMVTHKVDLNLPVPIPDEVTLRDRITTISDLIEDLGHIHSQLENGYANWGNLRMQMGVKEREHDNTVMEQFERDYDISTTLENMYEYIKTAERAKRTHEARGDLKEWGSFWDRFCVAVHNADPAEIPQVVKLQYLTDCLEGRAARLLSGLPLEGGNYNEAVDRLKNEFANVTAIKEELYHALNTLHEPNGNREDFRRFVDELDQLCMQLERYRENLDTLPILTTIQNKLPENILEKVLTDRKNLPTSSTWNTSKLRQKLRDLLHLQDELARTTARNQERKPKHTPPNRDRV
ncbi:gag protein [Ditylenchus destructor]|uniref:Gag protein n=1 Tax=Ditylenchus destructor TaxID=166010 RepID=A0AAD4ME02_9BILA|nr:gag protein [Ditylenchus destructor]